MSSCCIGAWSVASNMARSSFLPGIFARLFSTLFASRTCPSISPALTLSFSLSFLNAVTTLAAADGSSNDHAIPVIPVRFLPRVSAYFSPLSACFTSVFLTTRYATPFLRNSSRSFVTEATSMPWNVTKTADDILENCSLMPAICVVFSFLCMGQASSSLPATVKGSIFTPGPIVELTVMLRR
jgi:hypothetical protein